MYYRDHGPPHFHAIYGEHEVTVEIETGAVNGRFPTRALSLVQEWRQAHQPELLEDRALAKDREPLKKTAPLE